MARVVVVGGGLGGCRSAVRLAKQGHEVTLVERLPTIGGALGFVEEAGFRWDAGPSTTTLPAALRDLFRKSGRPLDRELDLVQLPLIREHRFEDGGRVSLPALSRTAQSDAIDSGLGDGSATAGWSGPTVSRMPGSCCARSSSSVPTPPTTHPRRWSGSCVTGRCLQRAVTKLRDKRLKAIALHHAVSAGHDPRNVPWWMGFVHHVEQSFGAWTVPGGLGQLAELLEKRLGERGVRVLTRTTAVDLGPDGVLDRQRPEASPATSWSCAIDPRRLRSLAGTVERTMPAIPPTICHVGLSGDVPDLPDEVVIHGDATITVNTRAGSAPDGKHAWTISARGRLSEDVLRALARQKIDIRGQVEARVDRSPRQQVEHLRQLVVRRAVAGSLRRSPASS